MNKRILSLFLVLCMILVALPVFAVAAVAEESAKTVNIYFVLPDGTEVAKRTIPEGAGVFEEPTADEITAAIAKYNANEKVKGYELTADDILGFYEVKPDGEIVTHDAYASAVINADKTFCAITTKAVFRPGVNWPLYTANTSFDGYRGGWTLASYNGSAFTTMSTLGDDNVLHAGDPWGKGGMYLAKERGITGNDGSLSLVWKAIAPGTVNLDLLALQFDQTGDGAKRSDIAVAVAKNGTIVWPAAAKDRTLADTWATAKDSGWFYADLGSCITGSVLDKYRAHCDAGDAPSGITVAAGDRIEIVLKRSQTPHITCSPVISYEAGTVGAVDAAAAGITTQVADIYGTTLSSNANYPTHDGTEGGVVTFRGNWDMLYYKKNVWGDSTRTLMNRVVNFAGGAGDTFFTDGCKLWGGNMVRVVGGHGYWGAAGSYTLSGSNKEIGGYRYTAEFSGVADISFSSYKTMEGSAPVAIFLNGQMIWPQVGNYFGNRDKWATATTTAATPENLPTDVILRKGDMVEFLVAAAPDGSGARSVELMPLTVRYSAVYTDAPTVQITPDNKVDSCDFTLTVNKAGMDTVKVEVADGRTGNFAELSATDGVYTAAGYERDRTAAYDVVFRFTYTKDGKTFLPQTRAVTVQSYFDANFDKVAGSAFADVTDGFTVADGEKVPAGVNGWDIVIYENVAAAADPANAKTDLYRWFCTKSNLSWVNHKTEGEIGGQDVAFRAGTAPGPWNAAPYAAIVCNGWVSGYRYTVPESGFAFLSVTSAGRALPTGWADAYNDQATKLAVTLNGRQIWPTDGTWYPIKRENGDLTATIKASIEAALSNVYVEKGDVIEYLITSANQNVYSSFYANFFGSVSVYQPKGVPTVPSQLDATAPRMDGTFGVRLTLGAADENVIDYETVATIGGRALTATYDKASNSILLSGILSTEMMQPLAYRVYAVSEHTGTDNVTVKHYHPTAAAETTYADLIAPYLDSEDVAVKDMAVAILNYGAAAQNRFLEEPGELPTTKLNGKTLSFETPTAEDKYAQADREGKAYAFSGATLLLQDRIRLKLIIDLQTGADMLDGDLYLEYGTDAGFAGAEKALLLQRGNEGDDKSNAHLKATLDILPTAFAATMYFRVVTAEGTVVSSTLTYSVSSYAARSTEDAALTAAILALGKAAENYGG